MLLNAGVGPAAAEATLLRIGRSPGFAFLPAYVLEHERLVERRVQELGLVGVTVDHGEFSGGNVMNGALLAGDLEIALGGVPPFLILWARSAGTRQEVKALAAVSALPSVLLSRRPTVHSIRDLDEHDRISVAAVGASQVAILLQMACAQTFGADQWGRLDHQTVSLPQPESLAAMVSSRSEITAHFTVPPYDYLELKSPAVHAILHSREVLGGVGTVIVAYAQTRFHDTNPILMKALFRALQDAHDLVAHEPKRAAEIYLSMTKEPLTVEELETLIRDPDLNYDVTPRATQTFADFMAKIGALPHKPAGWKALFFPEVHELPGS